MYENDLVLGVELALQEISEEPAFDGGLDKLESRVEALRVEAAGLGTNPGDDGILHLQRKLDLHRTFGSYVSANEAKSLF